MHIFWLYDHFIDVLTVFFCFHLKLRSLVDFFRHKRKAATNKCSKRCRRFQMASCCKLLLFFALEILYLKETFHRSRAARAALSDQGCDSLARHTVAFCPPPREEASHPSSFFPVKGVSRPSPRWTRTFPSPPVCMFSCGSISRCVLSC